jgi:transcriptional antiterminator NusG
VADPSRDKSDNINCRGAGHFDGLYFVGARFLVGVGCLSYYWVVNTMAKRWYVVHAYSGYEKKVAVALQERIDLNDMQESFGDVLVPTEEVVEMRGGQKRTSERKFFPGYVLVQMELNDASWHLVKDTPRVMGFIGGKADKPAPITNKEAELILQRMDDSVEAPKPKTLFEPGEMVRVIDGPFNDFNGTVEEVNYEKSRLQVAVLIFGRSTPVELEFGQVEKV